MAPNTSLSVIAKDVENKLHSCLKSLACYEEETIVTDTGSTDRTREIAAGFGARVIDFPWVDDFAAAQKMLEDAIAVDPKAESLWVLLSYAYLQEGRDWPAAEHALRQVLALNPANAEARRNLEILLRQQAKASA